MPIRRILTFAVLLFAAAHVFAADALSPDEIAWLESRREITFAGTVSYPPFEFIHPRSGEFTGITIELIRWMGTELGFTPVFKLMNFKNAQDAVSRGSADAITGLFDSPERRERYEFTRPIFTIPAVIFVRADRPDISEAADLGGKRVGVMSGDYAVEYFDERDISAEIVESEGIDGALGLLIRGDVDAAIGDEQVAMYWLYTTGNVRSVKRVGPPLYSGSFSLASRKGNEIVRDILEKGIRRAERTGVLDRITGKYLGTASGTEERDGLGSTTELAIIVGIFALAAGAAVFGVFRFRKLAKDRARALKTATEQLARDNTEKKRLERDHVQLEERMVEAQKAESLVRLAGGVAHDFNNLLTAIVGEIDLALSDLPEDSTARDSLRTAVSIAQQAGDLARRMLDYSGRGRFVVTELDAAAIVREMVGMLEASAGKKTAIVVEAGEGLPRIRADVIQFKQVVMNLVINAAEVMVGRKGVVRVRVYLGTYGPAELSASRTGFVLEEGDYVTVEVADQGPGIEPETLARIFDPFFTTKRTGRGLGLAAVVGIMRSHSGAILVDSIHGKGTTFRVLFPSATGLDAEQAGGGQGSGGRSILLVEDEDSVRNVVQRIMESAGFTVIPASGGVEAMGKYAEAAGSFTGVVIDLTMPGMSGIETMRAIRELNPEARIVLTGGHNDSEASDLLEAGEISGFLKKPYRMDNLMTILRNAFPPKIA
ncbi:MAG: transporter substrate-binding domain-containing protein [Spirochaetes bacterium]|nr:transporter substrate-binding domain-containing protein [Spirochaetota bacterium]